MTTNYCQLSLGEDTHCPQVRSATSPPNSHIRPTYLPECRTSKLCHIRYLFSNFETKLESGFTITIVVHRLIKVNETDVVIVHENVSFGKLGANEKIMKSGLQRTSAQVGSKCEEKEYTHITMMQTALVKLAKAI